MSVQEVNRLELELLRLLDYRLAVPWEEVRAVMRQLLAGSFVVGQGEVRGLRDVVVAVQPGWGVTTRGSGVTRRGPCWRAASWSRRARYVVRGCGGDSKNGMEVHDRGSWGCKRWR